MQPVCEVLNTRLEQPNNTKQATSNDHEWDKQVHSKAVTVPPDGDTSKCNNSQVLWVFIREWQSTNEGLGSGAYRKKLYLEQDITIN